MAANLFAPSAYTAALLLYLQKNRFLLPLNNVLEMGIGSGVLLASALQLGARQATGVDIENAAVEATRALLIQEGLVSRAQLGQGDLWSAAVVQGQTFDFIISNLPQFACERVPVDGHLPSWSAGGTDGRDLMNPFLSGLHRYLSKNGRAVITHNVFLDFESTQQLIGKNHMTARVAQSVSVPLPSNKLNCMNPHTLKRYNGHGVKQVGGNWFVDFDVLEITWS